jgi:hypothetical protein
MHACHFQSNAPFEKRERQPLACRFANAKTTTCCPTPGSRAVVRGFTLIRRLLFTGISLGVPLVAGGILLRFVGNEASGADLDLEPTALIRVNSSQAFPGLAVSGRYAYLLAGSEGLVVSDITDPRHPVIVGSYNSTGQPESVALSGTFAYLVDGAVVDGSMPGTESPGEALIVLDVSHPSQPTPVGRYAPGGFRSGSVAVSDRYAVLVGRWAQPGSTWQGLHVLDIGEAAQPRLLGALRIPGTLRGVAIEGSHAYVAAGDAGLRVIDISDPSGPREVGTYASGGMVGQQGVVTITVSNAIALVGDHPTGLHWVDVSNPSAPRRVSVYPVSGLSGVARMGNSAWIAFTSDAVWPDFAAFEMAYPHAGLEVVDYSRPASPVRTGRVLLAGGSSGGLAVAGSAAFLAVTLSGRFPQGGLLAEVEARSADPYRIGQSFPDTPRMITLSGSYAYVASGTATLDVLLLSDTSAPRRVASHRTRGTITAMNLQGAYAFITTETNGMEVIDVSDPAQPRSVGDLPAQGWVGSLVVAGSHAFLSGAEGLYVVDVSTPARPRQVGSCALNGGGVVGAAGDYVYAISWNAGSGLQVIDVSDVTRPELVGQLDFGGNEFTAAVAPPYALVGGSFGLAVVDLSTPTAPRQVGQYGLHGVTGVTIQGRRAYLGATYGGLVVLDVDALPSIRRVGGCSAFAVGVRGAQADSGRVLVHAVSEGWILLEERPRFESFARIDQALGLSWVCPGPARLEWTPTLLAPRWQTVPGSEGTNALAFPLTAPAGFFRVGRP